MSGIDDYTKASASAPGLLEITDIEGFMSELGKLIGPHLEKERSEWERRGPAATGAFEATGGTLDSLGGNCPVQAEGSVDGKRFYFRARGGEWRFHVADDDDLIFDNPLFYIERDYGEGPYAAGWMPRHEALGFIVQSIAEYRAAQGGVTEGGDGEAGSVSEANSTRSAEGGCAPNTPEETE